MRQIVAVSTYKVVADAVLRGRRFDDIYPRFRVGIFDGCAWRLGHEDTLSIFRFRAGTKDFVEDGPGIAESGAMEEDCEAIAIHRQFLLEDGMPSQIWLYRDPKLLRAIGKARNCEFFLGLLEGSVAMSAKPGKKLKFSLLVVGGIQQEREVVLAFYGRDTIDVYENNFGGKQTVWECGEASVLDRTVYNSEQEIDNLEIEIFAEAAAFFDLIGAYELEIEASKAPNVLGVEHLVCGVEDNL